MSHARRKEREKSVHLYRIASENFMEKKVVDQWLWWSGQSLYKYKREDLGGRKKMWNKGSKPCMLRTERIWGGEMGAGANKSRGVSSAIIRTWPCTPMETAAIRNASTHKRHDLIMRLSNHFRGINLAAVLKMDFKGTTKRNHGDQSRGHCVIPDEKWW